jgi:glycosyltransferase involved in cell wall biosynthesis
MKTLYYFSTIRLPNSRAHSIQIMKMCEAFSKNLDVTLFVGTKKKNEEEIFSFYNVVNKFSIAEAGPVFKGRLKYLSDIIVAVRVVKIIKKDKPDYVFMREPLLAFIISFFASKFFYENHTLAGKSKYFLKRIAKTSLGIISTNKYKKDWMVSNWKVPDEKILIAYNGVDVGYFTCITDSNRDLRKKFDLPTDSILIGHIGRLDNKGIEKGTGFIIESLAGTNLSKIKFCFIGCTEDEIKKYSAQAKELGVADQFMWRGHVQYELVPQYLKAMDYLLLLQSSSNETAVLHASALKVFEYMASGVPLLMPKLPALEETFSDSSALFYEPESKESFREAVLYMISHSDEMRRRGAKGLETARRFDWNVRAQNIFEFMERHGK